MTTVCPVALTTQRLSWSRDRCKNNYGYSKKHGAELPEPCIGEHQLSSSTGVCHPTLKDCKRHKDDGSKENNNTEIWCFAPRSNMENCKGATLHSSSEMIFQLVCELRSEEGECIRGGVSDSISSATDGGGAASPQGNVSLSLSLSPPPTQPPGPGANGRHIV